MSNGERRLADGKGRTVRYLRLSITDRCNLRCFYCNFAGRNNFIPHARILRYEQIYRLVGIARKMGVGKARVTGGEPFARKDCMGLLAGLRRQFPDLRLCVTTNGTLLDGCLDDLARLAPESINISIDSFDPEVYASLTGENALNTVLANMDGLLQRGARVKINAVAIRGVTDTRLSDYIHVARTMPVELRFIEFMPIGRSTTWSEGRFLPHSELLTAVKGECALHPAPAIDPLAGPARVYRLVGGRGAIGFISAISGHFCQTCNRMRLTADGGLRACLFDDRQYRLGGALRNGKVSDAAIARVFRQASQRKPLGADLLRERSGVAVACSEMSGIGG